MDTKQKDTNSFATFITKDGQFQRKPTTFRHHIKADGSTEFPPENDRYHLYVSYACPWASRCLAVRSLKGLKDAIPVHTVSPIWGQVTPEGEPVAKSWVFASPDAPIVGGVDSTDPLYGLKSLRQLYELSDKDYVGRYTVPVLWDSKTKRIVNNESSEIIQMLNDEFQAFAKNPQLNLRPADLLEKIDALNTWMYETINNGVYKCGFAASQEAYEKAFHVLFAHLTEAEEKLQKSRYLLGNKLTESDIRLFVTIVRFDTVYVGHFKTNKKRIIDYPALWGWVRDVYQYPGIKESVNWYHIKHGYGSLELVNPSGVIPLGPDIDFDSPHGRSDF